MARAVILAVAISQLLLYAGAQEQAPALVLHVTQVKSEYVGDKPTQKDCKKIPCTTMIITVEAHSVQTNFVLECRQWILLTDPMQTGKCWAFESSKDYSARRAGRTLLFYGDKEDTNPLYTIIEESERKKGQ